MPLSNPRRLVVLTAFLAALVLVGFASYAALVDLRSGSTAAAESRAEDQSNQRDKVAALGRIEPYSEIINLGAGTSPDRLESLFVQRGDLVKKDEVLGYLGGYAEQKAQRDMISAQLDEARSRLKAEVELDRARIKAAEVHQQQVLEVMPQRIAAQEATIASLEAKLQQ